jgi:hypothetical protein
MLKKTKIRNILTTFFGISIARYKGGYMDDEELEEYVNKILAVFKKGGDKNYGRTSNSTIARRTKKSFE